MHTHCTYTLLEFCNYNNNNVKQQQLDAKLKVLEDIDKQILDQYETGQIETEITDAEVVSAKVLACKQRIVEAIQRPHNEIHAPPASLSVASPPVTNKPKLPKLINIAKTPIMIQLL